MAYTSWGSFLSCSPDKFKKIKCSLCSYHLFKSQDIIEHIHIIEHDVILRSLAIAAVNGLRILIVYKCGGYESLEVIQILDGVVNIYMPDMNCPPLNRCCDWSGGFHGSMKEAN